MWKERKLLGMNSFSLLTWLINLFGMIKSKAFSYLNKVTKGVQELLRREKRVRGSTGVGKETEDADQKPCACPPVSHCLGFVTKTVRETKTLQQHFYC